MDTFRRLISPQVSNLALVPAFDTRHIWKFVGNTLVTINAGLFARHQVFLVRDSCTR